MRNPEAVTKPKNPHQTKLQFKHKKHKKLKKQAKIDKMRINTNILKHDTPNTYKYSQNDVMQIR